MQSRSVLILYLALLFLVFTQTVPAQQAAPLPVQQCAQHVPYGQPRVNVSKDTTVICRAGYYTEHDNNAKLPVWASYTLTPANALGCEPRTNAFATDQSLQPGRRATPNQLPAVLPLMTMLALATIRVIMYPTEIRAII